MNETGGWEDTDAVIVDRVEDCSTDEDVNDTDDTGMLESGCSVI